MAVAAEREWEDSDEYTGATAPADVAPARPIDGQPYPIRLVNWFMSK